MIIERATNIVLIGMAAGLVWLRLSGDRASERPPSSWGAPNGARIARWNLLGNGTNIIGDSNAPITILEFADFQCPACAEVQPRLARILKKYEGKVRIVFRHMPLRPESGPIAVAAQCAGEQRQFASMQSLLFRENKLVETAQWETLASRARVADMARFKSCLKNKETQRTILKDRQYAGELGVPATPSYIVDGFPIVSGHIDEIEERVREALKRLEIKSHAR
jgi:protein-disulfide isomerase